MHPETEKRVPAFFGEDARRHSSDTPVSVLNFCGPAYWRTWIMIAWLKLAALIPWRWSLALHKRLGRWLGSKSRQSVRVVDDNLKRCFPELSDPQRARLAEDYFANMGALIAELALSWFRSPRRVRSLIEAEGVEHLDTALARQRGVILHIGHFTTMEICGVGIGQFAPHFVIVQNHRRNQLLSEYQRRSRDRISDGVLSNRNARVLLRQLRNNSVVLVAGDEADFSKHAVRLPFFGEPAWTSTAVSRLARISGAAVVPMAYGRKPDDSGYFLRFCPAIQDLPTDDATADTRRLVAILEEQIRACPEQYFWKQRRFRDKRPEPPAA